MARNKATTDVTTLRSKLLDAALEEFGDKGFAGARVEEIANAAGASKQALYHHFGSKEGIFAAAVAEAYRQLRAPDQEVKERLESLEPAAALREFIEHLFQPSIETIRFQRIMHDENRFKAIHAKELADAKQAYAELLEVIGNILERGRKAGVFRSGVDPKQLYVFIAGVLVYRLTNAYTLSSMLGLSLDDDKSARLSRRGAIQLILDALRPVGK